MTTPSTVTIHRSDFHYGLLALLLFWIASVWWAHECGRTDEAEWAAHVAQERAWRASIR